MARNNIVKFWSKVDKSGECWNWIGMQDKDGYGRFYISHPQIIKLAHRFSYFIHNGFINDKLMVCHSCDNPSCVNPSHLFQGTAKDNADDMIKKGRQSKGDKVPYEKRIRGENHRDTKFKKEDILNIRTQYATGITMDKLAFFYKVQRSTIARIIRGESWAHIKEGIDSIKHKSKGIHNAMAIFTEQDILEIRKRHAVGNISMYKIAKEYNVNFNTISKIIHRATWCHI